MKKYILFSFIAMGPIYSMEKIPEKIPTRQETIALLSKQISTEPIDQLWDDKLCALENDVTNIKKDVGDALFDEQKCIFFKLTNYLQHPDFNTAAKSSSSEPLKILSNTKRMHSSVFAKTPCTIQDVALNHNGSCLAIASACDKIEIFNTNTLDSLGFSQRSPVTNISFADSDYLCTFSRYGWAVFDIKKNKISKSFEVSKKASFFKGSSNGKYFLKEHPIKNRVHLCLDLNPNGCATYFRLTTMGKPVTAFAADDQLRRVLIVFQGRILVHGQREEGLEFFWKNVDAPIVPEYIQIIDVHANGKWGLAIHGKQGYIYNLENGQVTVARTIALKDKAITTARFSPCGKYLLTGYSNGAFSLYDWQKKNELYLGKSDHTITGVSLSGDGDTIVARSDFGLFLTSCKEMRALSPLAKVVLSQLSLEKDNTALFKTKSFQKIVNSFAPELKEKLIAEFGLKEEDASAEECLICRAEPAVFTTSCNHNFCPTCIARWQVEHSTCPTCRRNL